MSVAYKVEIREPAGPAASEPEDLDGIPRISHRDFRNNSGAVLRAVEAGTSYVITNHGRPVVKLVPLTTPAPGLPISRPRTNFRSAKELPIHNFSRPTQELIDELREDRV